MQLEYSNPQTDRGISVETLPDKTTVIEVRPLGRPGVTSANQIWVILYLGASLALPVAFMQFTRIYQPAPFVQAATIMAFFIAPALGAIIYVLTTTAATRRTSIRVTADALDIEQTARFEDRVHYQRNLAQIEKVVVEIVPWTEDRRVAVCVYSDGQMKSFLADRTPAEVQEVANAIHTALKTNDRVTRQSPITETSTSISPPQYPPAG